MNNLGMIPATEDFKQFLADTKKGSVINDLIEVMRDHEAEHRAAVEHSHFFIPDFYLRQMKAPAGSMIVTEVHMTLHTLHISRGKCLLFDEVTEERFLVEAPFFTVTQPGTRRVIYVLEDSLWTTMHRTDSTDLEQIKKEIILDSTLYLGHNNESKDEPA